MSGVMRGEALQLAPRTPAAVRRRNTVLVVLAIVGAIAALLTLVRSALGDPPARGPAGSSYATTTGGVAALSELATRAGHRVEQITTDPRDVDDLGGRDTTVVVLGADLVGPDALRVTDAIVAGTRVIADVGGGNQWIVEQYPVFTWRAETNPGDRRATVTMDGTSARELRLDGLGTIGFDPAVADQSDTFDVGDGTEIASLDGTELGTVAYRFSSDDGEVVVLADASMLTNARLAQADNAAFALALLDGRERVQFVETIHGYRDRAITPTGLPWRVRWFLGGLLAATVVLMWSRSRRNGPPEVAERELAPPRSAYLHAMTTALDGEARRRFRPRRPAAEAPPSIDPPAPAPAPEGTE